MGHGFYNCPRCGWRRRDGDSHECDDLTQLSEAYVSNLRSQLAIVTAERDRATERLAIVYAFLVRVTGRTGREPHDMDALMSSMEASLNRVKELEQRLDLAVFDEHAEDEKF